MNPGSWARYVALRFGTSTWVPKMTIKGKEDSSNDSDSSNGVFQPEIAKYLKTNWFYGGTRSTINFCLLLKD